MLQPYIDLSIDPQRLELIYRYYYRRGMLAIVFRELYNLLTLITILTILGLILYTISIRYGIIILIIIFTYRLVSTIIVIARYYPIYRLYKYNNLSLNKRWNEIALDIAALMGIDNVLFHRILLHYDNYMIALVNHKLLPTWYSLALEWSLKVWLGDFTSIDKVALKRRALLLAFIFFFLSPVMLIYIVLYYLFGYFTHVKSSPFWLFDRRWTRYAQWTLRCYNEVPHLLEQRLESARPLVETYMNLVNTSPLLIWTTKIVRFIVSTLLFLLTLLSFQQETIYGYPILNIIGFGIILLATLYRLPGKVRPLVERAEELHTKITLKLRFDLTDRELSMLYRWRIVIFLSEIGSVVIIPFYFIKLYLNSYEFSNVLKSITEYYDGYALCTEGDFTRIHNQRMSISSNLFYAS